MTEPVSATPFPRPRHPVGIFVIALVLGPGTLMLWLGCGRLAIAYFVLSVVATIAVFMPVHMGLVPMAAFANHDVSTLVYVANLVVAPVGLVHGLWIRRAALERPWFSHWYVMLLLPHAVILSVALLVRTFLFQPFSIASTSEVPNLLAGDYVFVSKWAYGYSKYSFPFELVHFSGRIFGAAPKRGEIAVFRLPANPRIDYIKRVIGLPGDTVQITDGILHINGVAATRQAVSLPVERSAGQPLAFYRETLPTSESHLIAEIDDESLADNTGEFVVPAGHYFVMGDNRDNSQDSRYPQTGFIPEENFIGPVSLLFWNAQGLEIAGR